MEMAYTKEETLKELKNFLTKDKIGSLYAADFLNWSGTVKDGSEKYSEILAEQLLLPDNLALLESITAISRTGSYNANHEKTEIDPNSNREEEQIARSIKGEVYKEIGKIIDYQTPLKKEQSDKIGKIDLLSYNEDKNRAYIIEFKAPGSPETLLRCVLEAYTYSKTVDGKKLLRDFEIEGAELRKAVLVYESSRTYTEYSEDTKIRELMKALGVELFAMEEITDT